MKLNISVSEAKVVRELRDQIQALQKENGAYKEVHEEWKRKLREGFYLEEEEFEAYLRLKKENDILRECVEYYAQGEIGNDLEIKPEKKSLWHIPDKWAQRSMSDHYAGKRARQALREIGEER